MDQLRIENTALRSALQQAQTQLASAGISLAAPGSKPEDAKGDGHDNNGPSDTPQDSITAS